MSLSFRPIVVKMADEVATALQAIERDGYTVIEGVLDPSGCDELVADLVRLESELGTVPAGNSFEGAATWRIYNLLAYGPRYEAIPVDPRVLPVVEGVLDEGCLVSSLSSIAIGPGEQEGGLAAGGSDHDPPLRTPVVRFRRGVLEQLETQDVDEEGDGRVVLVDHQGDPFEEGHAEVCTHVGVQPGGGV